MIVENECCLALRAELKQLLNLTGTLKQPRLSPKMVNTTSKWVKIKSQNNKLPKYIYNYKYKYKYIRIQVCLVNKSE